MQQPIELLEQQVREMCGGEARYRVQTEIMAWGTYLAFAQLSLERHAGQREWVSTDLISADRIEAGVPITARGDATRLGDRLWGETATHHEGFDGNLLNVPPSRDLLTRIPADRTELDDTVKRIRMSFRAGGTDPSGRP